MNLYEYINGNVRQGAPSFLCSTTDYVQTTDKPDGSVLMVVNESTHKVSNYYVAFNGYWNEL